MIVKIHTKDNELFQATKHLHDTFTEITDAEELITGDYLRSLLMKKHVGVYLKHIQADGKEELHIFFPRLKIKDIIEIWIRKYILHQAEFDY